MKLKDIRTNIEESLDLGDDEQENNQNINVTGDKGHSFYDLGDFKGELDLGGSGEIILDKENHAALDSLSKKGPGKKDISLGIRKLKIKKKPSKKTGWRLLNHRVSNIYSLLFFFVIFVAGIFLYKDLMEKYLTYSYETLSFVKDDFPDYKKINEDIQESKNGFLITEYLFKPISFINTKSVRDAKMLIEGGKKLNTSFEQISRISFDLYILLNEKDISQILFSHFLDNSRQDFVDAINNMKIADSYYSQIDYLGDNNLDEKLDYLKSSMNTLLRSGEHITENYDTLLGILGHEKRKKYMIVFQNSDEIRPQGGFMGSVGFIEVFGGRVASFEKKDIYALEWEVNKDPYREEAPEGLDKITESFGLRDANYFIEPKASSLKIRELLKRGNIEIDGIIYLNINIVSDLLDSVGGIDSQVLSTRVTSENFALLVSSIVESKKQKVGTLGSPKDVLFQFIDELVLDFKQEKDYNSYAKVFMKNIASRDLFMYSFDDKEQKMLTDLQLDGSIDFQQTFDYNYPVFTSLSGNKSDRYMERKFSKYVQIFDNCVVSTRLNIKLRHNFNLAEEKKVVDVFKAYDIDIDTNLNIQGRGKNKQFVRIVLPKDSIIKNQNVVVKNYPRTRVAEFYMETERFESSNFVLSYIQPNTECRDYDYTLYKQAGIDEYDLQFVFDSETQNVTGIRRDFEYKLK